MKRRIPSLLVACTAFAAALEAEKISPFVNAKTGEPLPAVEAEPFDSMDPIAEAMDNQMKRMVEIVMEEQIRFLEKPDTLKRIAKVMKNQKGIKP